MLKTLATGEVRFIPKKNGRFWGVYDRATGSWPLQRPETGVVDQKHRTETSAQEEAERLSKIYEAS